MVVRNLPRDCVSAAELDMGSKEPLVLVHPFSCFISPVAPANRSSSSYLENLKNTLQRYGGDIFVLEYPDNIRKSQKYAVNECNKSEGIHFTPATEAGLFSLQSPFRKIARSRADRINLAGGSLDYIDVEYTKDGSMHSIDAGSCLGVIMERILALSLKVNLCPEIIYDYTLMSRGETGHLEKVIGRFSHPTSALSFASSA